MAAQLTNNSEGGYRLRVLEIFNWGTFDGKVYSLKPDGRTSLLTGANGSGKTTLIDALLTLMVPSNKRFYNQSSGAENKKERDEYSYFWGHYGKSYSDAEERSTMEQLRNKNDNPYSVLLASFQNTATRQTLTLVQVRWFASGALKRVYVVSPYQLNINDHFGKGKFDFKGDWKRKLQKDFPKTDLFESFKEYAGKFSDQFGLKEKALPLFNQTVGIKVLGDLTVFIRQQMLEEPDSEEQFIALHNHYTDLLLSHKAIQKDEQQLALLKPVVISKQMLHEIAKEASSLEVIRQQLPMFYKTHEYRLLTEYLNRKADEINGLIAQKGEVEKEIISLEAQQNQLISQKALMNVDSQVQFLQKDIQFETEKRDNKKQNATQYQQLAKNLALPADVNEGTFEQNKKMVTDLQQRLEEQYEQLTHQKAQAKIDNDSIGIKIGELQDTITSLLSRKNRIPHELVSARQRLAELLDIGENDLPFVGELIKVNEDSRHWEDAIERVLHSFSMRLLVPQRFLREVNQFVYANDLQAKLVYEKIENKASTNYAMRWPTDGNSLLNKIEVQESDGYKGWIEQQLLERYNYHCTDDLEVFYGSPKAVTSNGLIRNISRHEKDDRQHYWNKSKYRLGWDNKETVAYYREQKSQLQQKSEDLSKTLSTIQPALEKVTQMMPLVILFTTVKFFTEIDWASHAVRIEELSRQVEDLTKSNDKYQTILNQLIQVEKTLKEKRKTSESIGGNIISAERDVKAKSKQKDSIILEGQKEEGFKLVLEFLTQQSLDPKIASDLEAFGSLRDACTTAFDKKSQEVYDRFNKKKMETMGFISAFVHPEAKILNEYPDWGGDTLNINASLDSLDELENLYHTIKDQRLIEHKKRFQEYMDRSMLDALTNYRAWLFNEEERIKEIIDELNVPLKKITFNKNPNTYLQLECRSTRDPEIKEFIKTLSATIPNTLEFATQKEESYRKMVFEKIKSLVTDLKNEEAWRRRVTDIRNWLVFSAREYSVEDEKPGQYHDNTASYSGGQKAQFTYAILGAAIAHQFGIYEQGKLQRSLRFITVDEAFSKLDPEKSQFLMEFCAQLNLQILVVTPLDKINVAEPFIHAVHFVEIKNKKHSVVYNLSMQEYEERKEEFRQLAKIDDHS